MIAEGTKRKCAGGDHQVVYHGIEAHPAKAGTDFVPGWHHTSKADWVDHPHKAAPRKYKKKAKS